MKNIYFLFFLILCSFHSFSQAYVKFKKEPMMNLKASSTHFNYQIEYNALKKSTIYLELKKEKKIVANGVYDVNKSGLKIVKISIEVLPEVEKLDKGKGYSYKLYMYEGGRNDWSKKVCKTLWVGGVKVN